MTNIVLSVSPKSLFIKRLLLALIQAGGLFWLIVNSGNGFWANNVIYIPSLVIVIYIPIFLALGLTVFNRSQFIVFGLLQTLIVAGFWYYNTWLNILPATKPDDLMPSYDFVFYSVIYLFSSYVLLGAAASEQRRLPSYITLFDFSSKLIAQLLLIAIFTGIFAILLELSAALFNLVQIGSIDWFIHEAKFRWPITVFSGFFFLHVTDRRMEMVNGFRSLLLILLSFLLLFFILVVSVFMLSLCFTGLEPLWKTKFATSLLLSTSLVLVMLINAVYKGELNLKVTSVTTKVSLRWAVLLLMPIAIIAIYAFQLRVGEYGWTEDRIAAGVCIVLCLFYSLGYLLAVISNRFSWIGKTNIFILFIFVAAYWGLFSPIADIRRLAVNNQIARLASGAVAPDKFDFSYLHWEAGRFGYDALTRLATETLSANPTYVNRQAKLELEKKMRWTWQTEAITTPQQRRDLIHLVKGSQALPDSFVNQNWDIHNWELPDCLIQLKYKKSDGECYAYVGNNLAQKGLAILTLQGMSIKAFQQDTQGTWIIIAEASFPYECYTKFSDKFKNNQFSTVPPELPPLNNLDFSGQRLQLIPKDNNSLQCD